MRSRWVEVINVVVINLVNPEHLTSTPRQSTGDYRRGSDCTQFQLPFFASLGAVKVLVR